METNFLMEIGKEHFFKNICRTLRGLESFIAEIQMKNCIFCESVLPKDQNCFYPDEFTFSKGTL